MPNNPDDKVRIHLMLYESDVQFLKKRFGDVTGISAAVRKILHEWVKSVERQAAARSATPIRGTVEFEDHELEPTNEH